MCVVRFRVLGELFTAGSPTGTIVSVGSLGRASMIGRPETCKDPKNISDEAILRTFFKACDYNIYIYIYHHHHQVVRPARISLTLSRHFSQSFIVFGRSSGLHPVSSHSCCMYVRDGRPAFDWPYAGVHRSTSLTSSSLLLQQCPTYLVRLACIVFVIGGRWPYSWCRVGCCCQDLFNTAFNILV